MGLGPTISALRTRRVSPFSLRSRASPGNRTRIVSLEGCHAIRCANDALQCPAEVPTPVPPGKSRLHHLNACRALGRMGFEPHMIPGDKASCCNQLATGQLAREDLNFLPPMYQIGALTR